MPRRHWPRWTYDLRYHDAIRELAGIDDPLALTHAALRIGNARDLAPERIAWLATALAGTADSRPPTRAKVAKGRLRRMREIAARRQG